MKVVGCFLLSDALKFTSSHSFVAALVRFVIVLWVCALFQNIIAMCKSTNFLAVRIFITSVVTHRS